jgi:thioredoxin reductase (NADPH)
MTAGQVDNFPGVAPSVCGPALAAAMRDQAQRFGAELHAGDVDRFDLHGAVKTVAISDDLRHARALILAMGSINRPLNVPGEGDLLGRGLSTSAKLDGDKFTGCEVAVVGGGDAVTEEALYLASRARRVTLVHHRPQLRASAIAVARLRTHPNVAIVTSTQVLAVCGKHHVTGLRVRDIHSAAEYDIDVAAVLSGRRVCGWRPDRPPIPASGHCCSHRLRGCARRPALDRPIPTAHNHSDHKELESTF